MTVREAIEAAVTAHQRQDIARAETLYRQVLAVEPNHPIALQYLGVIAYERGADDAAIDLIEKSLRVQPNSADALSNLGLALQRKGLLPRAIECFRQAVRLDARQPYFHNNLGLALRAAGDAARAIACHERAIALAPAFAAAHFALGRARQAVGQIDAAINSYEAAIRLAPRYAEAHSNVGMLFNKQGRLDEALAHLRLAVEIDSQKPGYHSNLATVHAQRGESAEALDRMRTAVRMFPREAWLYSGLLSYLQVCRPDDPNTLEETKRFDTLHVRHPPSTPSYANTPEPNRRLRVGYFSPDLGDHPAGRFLLPLLQHHDPARVEVFCYSSLPREDAMTARLRAAAHHTKNIGNLSDEQAAAVIQDDGIDIFVDLAMHTAFNRLPLFGLRPAPVQITYLAYCGGTTGLRAIDHRLTDPHLDPPAGGPNYCSEPPLHLPSTYWCYQAGANTPEPGPPPSAGSGRVTFGSFGRLMKLSAVTLDAWARVLLGVEGSSLLLHANEGSHRGRLLGEFLSRGVEPSRVRFADSCPFDQYLRRYEQIDIVLDTYPCSGGTTTCDALWMGVPVVTRAGDVPMSRGGASILINAGLPELVAYSEDEFVGKAVSLARDIDRLALLRRSIRPRMLASPLMDAKRFAGDVEDAYRRAWRRWCEAQ